MISSLYAWELNQESIKAIAKAEPSQEAEALNHLLKEKSLMNELQCTITFTMQIDPVRHGAYTAAQLAEEIIHQTEQGWSYSDDDIRGIHIDGEEEEV